MWKPRVDIPECTRCCFCIPLRYGLLAWGYVKAVLLFLTALFIISEIVSMNDYYKERNIKGHNNAFPIVVAVIIIIDLIACLFFIAAAHMKYRKMLKYYYYYSLAVLMIFIVGTTILTVMQIVSLIQYTLSAFFWMYLMQNIFFFFMVIVAQMYMTLLLKAEVAKLKNDTNYQFVNNVAVGEAAMRDDDADGGSAFDGIASTY